MTSITYVRDGLYTGQKRLENGKKIHFGFEKVDQNNIEFWRSYEKTATCFAESARAFCMDLDTQKLSYPNIHADYFCLDESEFERVVDFFKKKEYTKVDKINPFKAVEGGLCGMEQVLQVSGAFTTIHVVYASKTPVVDIHAIDRVQLDNKIKQDNVQGYKDLYGDILMSLVFITTRDTPTVTHYGIFRNPLDFFDVNENFRGISMVLHGFSATVALTECDSMKQYMITTPMESMREIFIRSMPKGLYFGTNLDLISPENVQHDELQKKYPPIYHIDKVTRVHKLAKPGTDLRQHLHVLPDDRTDLIEDAKQQFDNSGWTIGALKVVVSLEELSKFYL